MSKGQESAETVVDVPAFYPTARHKLDALLADGWRINGYAIIKGEIRRGFVDFGGFVGWWLPEYYASHSYESQPSLLTSGKALAAPDCTYDGENIIIPCGSHSNAIRVMREFRDALARLDGSA